MKILKKNWTFNIKNINYNIINILDIYDIPSYYISNINTYTNKDFINIISNFELDDLISLSKNKLTNNIIYNLNKVCNLDLYKILNHKFYYIDEILLYDLFVPFKHISAYKNNVMHFDNNIFMNETYFSIIQPNEYGLLLINEFLFSINKFKSFTNPHIIEFLDIAPNIIKFDNYYYSNVSIPNSSKISTHNFEYKIINIDNE
ncbi:hypothetical protein [Alphaentomopoxvirus acuprea]|uniref:Uncharacterized protein n=1 Tax=Alphaentomopoxvirus acuprea TaxID=62099 RepID=W6JPK1_9POXV|nr:hypothetical protein BA82_gp059 [Anomala cuprea entomopoxvirus]BAO49419.1 hypothetical protein [Anomala cuprea entomopoxvirus]